MEANALKEPLIYMFILMLCDKLVTAVLACYTKTLPVCGIIKTKVQNVFACPPDLTSGCHWHSRK